MREIWEGIVDELHIVCVAIYEKPQVFAVAGLLYLAWSLIRIFT